MSTPRAGPKAAAGKLRIGVIGAGFGRAVHVPAFRADGRCEIAAIAASRLETAQQAARELGIGRATDDWRTVVDDPDVDAVSVALPPTLQPQVAGRAISNGKHVFLEKPLATNVPDAEALLAAAGKAGVAHAIDFEFPEIPAWQAARAMLSEIGQLRNVVVLWHFETYTIRSRADSWKLQPRAGGGVLNHFVSHVFHNVEWLAGPIARLSGRLLESGGIPEVLTDIQLELASGVPVTISVASNAIGGSGHTVQLFGERGSLTLRNPGPAYFAGFELVSATREGGTVVPTQPLQNDRIEVVSTVARRFVDAALGGAAAEPNLRHGVRAQRLIQAVRDSNASRGWVDT